MQSSGAIPRQEPKDIDSVEELCRVYEGVHIDFNLTGLEGYVGEPGGEYFLLRSVSYKRGASSQGSYH